MRGGFQRILGHCDSGRDFVQRRQDEGEALAKTTWFDALHSSRRAAMVAEVATRSYEIIERFLAPRDWLGAFPELACRAVWAVDGHQLAHACHAQRDPKGEFVSVGLFATPAPARRFPTHKNSRDFPAGRASAPGSPPCSLADIPPPRSNAGVDDDAHQARRR